MVLTAERLSVLIGLCTLSLLILAEADGITPEDVRFASERCQNDSTKDPLLRAQWAMRVFPDDHETHCYIKCLLGKLGLINLVNRGLDGTKFILPLESQEVEVSEDCYTLLEDKIGGMCAEYYRKWMDLRQTCPDFFNVILVEDHTKGGRVVPSNVSQTGKTLGETATEFCSRSQQDSASKELTSAQVMDNDILSQFKCELECVFRHFHFFDAYGRIDEFEIKRAYREAKTDSKSNLRVISKCAHRSNALYPIGPHQMAYELYQCLLKQSKTFRKTYENRDKITRNY